MAAAHAALHRDGDVDLVAAMAANASRDFIMLDDKLEPINVISEDAHPLARLWEDALGAALDACCADWRNQPMRGFWLGLDGGGEIIQPYYTQPPAETFKLGDDER